MRGTLSISLSAIQNNYRLLQEKAALSHCAAVVKANAYGLGIEAVGPALHQAGATTFFVALLEEGITLRALLPSVTIYVLNGMLPNEADIFRMHHLVPVLNHPQQLAWWDKAWPCALHIDTGLNRLGFHPNDLDQVEEDRDVILVMSHLACADQPDHALNALQNARFFEAAKRFSKAVKSLAASDGIYLGNDFHADLVRPGAALYGVNPSPYQTNPMQSVVTLSVPVLQIRDVQEEGTAGYAASCQVKKGQRLATVSVGYADGFFRSLSNSGALYYNGQALPVLGRVSMDVVIVDISALPHGTLNPGDLVDVFGPDQSPDDLAKAAGTIGYELLTSLGQRFNRVYTA